MTNTKMGSVARGQGPIANNPAPKPPSTPSGISRPGVEVTDEMADRAAQAFHEFVLGPEEPMTRRELGITRQAWKYALKEALK